MFHKLIYTSWYFDILINILEKQYPNKVNFKFSGKILKRKKNNLRSG